MPSHVCELFFSLQRGSKHFSNPDIGTLHFFLGTGGLGSLVWDLSGAEGGHIGRLKIMQRERNVLTILPDNREPRHDAVSMNRLSRAHTSYPWTYKETVGGWHHPTPLLEVLGFTLECIKCEKVAHPSGTILLPLYVDQTRHVNWLNKWKITIEGRDRYKLDF